MIGCQDNAVLKIQAEVEEKNIELVRKLFTEWNNRNLEYYKEACAPDYMIFGSDRNFSLLLLNLRAQICEIPGLEAPFWV